MRDQFSEVLKSKDLKDISIDIVEKVLDNQITDEVLKEIPIVKSLIAVKNLFTSYSDRVFVKKAMKVLLELGETTLQERERLVSELEDEDSNGTEQILLAVESLETYEKCKVYGRLCKLKATDKIDLDDFLRLTKLIQDAYLDDLILVTDFKPREGLEIHEGDYYNILRYGLIYQEPSEQTPITRNEYHSEGESEISGGEIKFNYFLSNLGVLVQHHYLDLFPNNNVKY